jgi:uncharacterized LabA/DUF88 family protein
MSHHAHAFIDGAQLRRMAELDGLDLPDPRTLARQVVTNGEVQEWALASHANDSTVLTRVTYYDARPDSDEDVSPDLPDYSSAIELLPSTHLGFDLLRGGTDRRPPRQKGVDTIIAVDLLVGAFTGIFSVAVLVSGDADFVPVVVEARRRGVAVVVAADERMVSRELRRAADRFIPIGESAGRFPTLNANGRTWKGRS